MTTIINKSMKVPEYWLIRIDHPKKGLVFGIQLLSGKRVQMHIKGKTIDETTSLIAECIGEWPEEEEA